MSLDILGIGESALSAFQLGVAISSKNIAGSADPDYSRELIECSSIVGGGLDVNIKRISDHFLSTQLNQAQASYGESSASSSVLSSIDQFITGLNGSDEHGSYNIISHNMQNFFDSLSTLSTSVTNAGREGVITNAQMLATALNNASQYVMQQSGSITQSITDNIAQINSLAAQVAKLNDKVAQTGSASPDLLDQRDKLMSQLSQYVGATSVEKNGQITVYMKDGSTLVSGNRAAKLAESRDGFQQKIQLTLDGSPITTPESLSGSLGGYINTFNNQIPAIQEKIGLLSASLVTLYNAQNQQGYVSANTHGGNIFQPIQTTGISGVGNTGDATISVQIDPTKVAQLKATSYTLSEVSAGHYELTDNTPGSTPVSFTSFPTTIDGLTIDNPTGSMNAGDRFLINPMDQAANLVKVTAGPNDIALSDQTDGTGTGNINGLANIANQKIMNNGQETLSDNIADMFSSIGTIAQTANDNNGTAKMSLDQATNDRQSLSGVNTQEEYTNIIHFQQSYSAAAKIISTDEKLFDSIISAIGA